MRWLCEHRIKKYQRFDSADERTLDSDGISSEITRGKYCRLEFMNECLHLFPRFPRAFLTGGPSCGVAALTCEPRRLGLPTQVLSQLLGQF